MSPGSKKRRERSLERMFETRSAEWEAVGLPVEVDSHKMRRAWRELAVLIPILIGVIVGEQIAIEHVSGKHGSGLAATAIPIAAAALVLVLGWLISRDLAHIAPTIFRRMDPATAGTVEFLIRFAAVAATVLGALAIAGVDPRTLAVGGAFTAVVLGLAAQQTLGNLFAGMVLLTARPFRLGERIRLQAGAVGGFTEGVVSSLGLLYTTLARGDDRIMIPNNVVLAAVVVPLREPAPVDVKVRLGAGIRPSHVQAILEGRIATATRAPVEVLLEEIDGDEVVVRVRATPERTADSAALADEIIAALVTVTSEHGQATEKTAPAGD
jgi:small-conductance mechanosensitive channel